jgi:hypothetical protein
VFWQSISQSSNPADFDEYLRQYPKGRFAGLAHNRLVALRPPPPTQPPTLQQQDVAPPPQSQQPPSDQRETARLLQTELRRVGCYTGPVDGKWGQPVSDGLRRFNQRSGTSLDVQTASLDAVAAVRDRTGRVCPLSCPRGQYADGDRCVVIACQPGFVRSSNGQCVVRQERPAPVAARPAQAPSMQTMAPPSPSPPSQGKRCITAAGQVYCE